MASGLLFAFAFSAVWAVLELIASRLQGGYDVLQIEGCRFALQLALMGAVWGWRSGTPLWRTGRPLAQLVRALLMLAIPLSFGVAVLQGASPHLAMTGLWVAPVFALLLARGWLLSKAPLLLWVAAAAGLCATVAMLEPARPPTLQASVVPLLMGLAFAGYLALTRSLRHEPAMTNLFWVGLGGLVGVLPFLPGVWVTPTLHDALVFAALGVVGFAALWLLEQALRRAPLPWIAPALYVHVACLTGVSLAVRGHLPSLRIALGLLMVGGIALALWRAAIARDLPAPRAPIGAPMRLEPATGPVPLDDETRP
ncbi:MULTISPECIES: DMT family transporter [unclassified Rhizobacter]|uniref:DMT family transporter n=1 Tax=unclassified Rhizobacter TaxID=2640088 RepID=UPI0006F6AE11|nr:MULTISPECIES: DMT family transporter [unclassified Rhizobacter]KQU73847.1 hypothetical protein ASC88_27760 [Rhizobacter sp. Root29]KQW11277.1 hypothetical protein ASC98_22060 [Rhizobacter sp. Root1238]KRB18222.1 hypothetical protein ASE08_24370 [Rhizobacter sp. Root16D2]